MDNNNSVSTLHEPLLLRNIMIHLEHEQQDDDNEMNGAEDRDLDEESDRIMRQDISLPWYHNVAQVAAMLSNFSTSYNAVNISLVLPILQQLQSQTSTANSSLVASTLLAGMMLGQVLGGFLGDSRLGRMGALRLVMILQILASLGSATCTAASRSLYLQLALWRFVLGIGAGAVYPLSAVLSAEMRRHSTVEASIHRVVLTFSMQGVGFVTVPLLAVYLLSTVQNLEIIWRILLGMGALPGIALLIVLHWNYSTLREQPVPLSEPREYDSDEGEDEVDTILDSVPDAGMSEETRSHWIQLLREENLVQKLLGTAATWFLFDVLFYGNTLFQGIVLEAAMKNPSSQNALQRLQATAVHSLILTMIELPGYAIAALVLGKATCGIQQSPRYVMLQGFACMGILYLTIGVYWHELRNYPTILILLYSLTFFFANYGPNTVTFLLPSMVYASAHRTTFNGLSAACGKLGALVGSLLFAPTAERFGDAAVLLMCAMLALVGMLLTKLFVKL